MTTSEKWSSCPNTFKQERQARPPGLGGTLQAGRAQSSREARDKIRELSLHFHLWSSASPSVTFVKFVKADLIALAATGVFEIEVVVIAASDSVGQSWGHLHSELKFFRRAFQLGSGDPPSCCPGRVSSILHPLDYSHPLSRNHGAENGFEELRDHFGENWQIRPICGQL